MDARAAEARLAVLELMVLSITARAADLSPNPEQFVVGVMVTVEETFNHPAAGLDPATKQAMQEAYDALANAMRRHLMHRLPPHGRA
jgi:hypothetical protein